MRVRQTYLVQAEFFHVGGKDTPSLGALAEECRDRREDGARLKTVVRFLYRGRKLISLARRWQVEETKIFRGRSFFGTRLLRTLCEVICGSPKDRARLAAIKSIIELANTSRKIAVEEFGSFRMARDDELYELKEAVQRSTSVWLFIFEPNDLCADENKHVAWII